MIDAMGSGFHRALNPRPVEAVLARVYADVFVIGFARNSPAALTRHPNRFRTYRRRYVACVCASLTSKLTETTRRKLSAVQADGMFAMNLLQQIKASARGNAPARESAM